MAVHVPGPASFMSVVAAFGLATAAVELISPFGRTSNVCTGSGAKAGSAEELTSVSQEYPVVNRVRKGDRLRVRSVAPETAVPRKEQWPVEMRSPEMRLPQKVPAAREQKGKLKISCELPFSAHLVSDDIELTPGRCVTDFGRPDRTFG